jgi:hypothetical protein
VIDGAWRYQKTAEETDERLFALVGWGGALLQESGSPLRLRLPAFASIWHGWWTARSSGASAIEGFLLSARGDYELHLGQGLSIGYLSRDTARIELHFQETLLPRPHGRSVIVGAQGMSPRNFAVQMSGRRGRYDPSA